ncbi:hydroxyacylglutathione hydrolase, partial [Buchnera aphidicola]|nr:hydroxyacylglutathione hydrolase [Buchnera aphidicola]
TLFNLTFSLSIMPNDKEIKNYYEKVKKGFLLCPTTIFFEKKINLFLRLNDVNLKKCIGLNNVKSDFQSFLRLRIIKDVF